MAFVYDVRLDLPGRPHPTECLAGREADAEPYKPKCSDPMPRHVRGVICELLGVGLEVPVDVPSKLAQDTIPSKAFTKSTRPLLNACRSSVPLLEAHIKVGRDRGVLPGAPPYTSLDIYHWGKDACSPAFQAEVTLEYRKNKKLRKASMDAVSTLSPSVDAQADVLLFKRMQAIYKQKRSTMMSNMHEEILTLDSGLKKKLAADRKELGALKDAFDPVSTMPDMDQMQLAQKSVAMAAAAGELKEGEVPSAQELKALQEKHGSAINAIAITHWLGRYDRLKALHEIARNQTLLDPQLATNE